MGKYKFIIEASEMDEEEYHRLLELLKTFKITEISYKPNSTKPLVSSAFCECADGPSGRMVTEDFKHQICQVCGLAAK